MHTPGGKTHVGTLTFFTTPNGRNEAWLFKRPGEEARHKDDAQSIRDSRKKAKRGNETGVQARVSIARRVMLKTRGGETTEQPSSLLSNEMLSAPCR